MRIYSIIMGAWCMSSKKCKEGLFVSQILTLTYDALSIAQCKRLVDSRQDICGQTVLTCMIEN